MGGRIWIDYMKMMYVRSKLLAYAGFIAGMIIFHAVAPFSILRAQPAVLPQTSEIEGVSAYLLSEFDGILREKGWTPTVEGNSLTAYRFNNDFDAITSSIDEENNDGELVLHVSVQRNDTLKSRDFRFPGYTPAEKNRVRYTVLPYLMEASAGERLSGGNMAFFASLTAGYSRVNDTAAIYPAWNEGALYLGFKLLYDPASRVKQDVVALTIGDYLSFSGFLTADPMISETQYDIHLLLCGTQWYGKNGESEKRTINGLFMGLEYRRPTIGYTEFTWRDSLYTNRPHVQYIIYKPCMWGFILTKESVKKYTFSFNTGPGFSINSSLNAVGLTPQEEADLSRIFKSMKYTDSRQNYYYAWAFPAAISLTADNIFRCKFEVGYNFYYFIPVEKEDAWDVLHIANVSCGYHARENILIKIVYEYWHADSRLEGEYARHNWNRLVSAVEYAF